MAGDLMNTSKNKDKVLIKLNHHYLNQIVFLIKSKQWYKDNKSMVGKRTYESIKEQIKILYIREKRKLKKI